MFRKVTAHQLLLIAVDHHWVIGTMKGHKSGGESTPLHPKLRPNPAARSIRNEIPVRFLDMT